MTKPGKCDSCRQRKVKCDEIRPTCGVCRKGGRCCTYTYGKAARFVTVQQKRRSSEALSDGSSSGDSITTRETSTSHSQEPAVVLSLRSTREAKSGSGLFQTFVPLCPDKSRLMARSSSKGRARKRSRSPNEEASPAGLSDTTRTPSPNLYPFGAKDRILARWASLMGTGGPDGVSLCPMYTFGDWVSLVAPQIAESDAVESAAACLVDSTMAYVNRDAQNFAAARESNATALRRIRMTIQCSDPSVARNDILVAIKLLFTVELFMGVYTQNYRFHGVGLVDLLQRISRRGRKCDEISRQIFYSSFMNDATLAIFGGRNSQFDEPSWLDVPPPRIDSAHAMACPKSNVAWQYIMRTFVRVPRLIRLVRKSRECPRDARARERAQELAAELFETDLEPWVEEVLRSRAMTVVATDRPDLEPYGPDSYHFASPRLFIILAAYWMTRILISGCVQTLGDLAPLPTVAQVFDQPAAWAEDMRAATNIAMCVQYAFKTSPILPVVPLRLQMPLIISFGAWHRLETRCLMLQLTGNDTPATCAEGAHAHIMKDWCVRVVRDISSRWNGTLTYMAEMEEKADSFAGGPLYQFASVPERLKNVRSPSPAPRYS